MPKRAVGIVVRHRSRNNSIGVGHFLDDTTSRYSMDSNTTAGRRLKNNKQNGTTRNTTSRTISYDPLNACVVSIIRFRQRSRALSNSIVYDSIVDCRFFAHRHGEMETRKNFKPRKICLRTVVVAGIFHWRRR